MNGDEAEMDSDQRRNKVAQRDDPSTFALLVEKHGPRPTIPLEEVRREYFPHLARQMFHRKLRSGDIPLPIIRMEASQKSPRSVHMRDLATYLEARRLEAKSIIAWPI